MWIQTKVHKVIYNWLTKQEKTNSNKISQHKVNTIKNFLIIKARAKYINIVQLQKTAQQHDINTGHKASHFTLDPKLSKLGAKKKVKRPQDKVLS